MSRCFPYPPPGYAGKCAGDEALILSIKLQRERERAKSEKKKDKRREKKEKRRYEKANGTLSGEKIHLSDKCGGSLYEHTEKSSLTEEHKRPCCSSDSTENSSKRKRQSLLPTTNSTRNQGTIIRIRLSTQKREDSPTTSSDDAALCSTSGRVDSLSEKADAFVKRSALSLHIPPLTGNATPQNITSSNKEASPCTDKGIDKGSTSKDKVKLPKSLRRYRALFESWVPPSLEHETIADDQEWLFPTWPVKRMKCCQEEVPTCGSHSLQPQAQFLKDADIYALPYTVPF